MVTYTHEPQRFLKRGDITVASFITTDDSNMDSATVASFGSEWQKFDKFSPAEVERVGMEYFDVAGKDDINGKTILDAGCGSGRWSNYMSPRAAWIEAVDPSEAILSAARNHSNLPNVRFTQAGIAHLPFPPASFDTVVCLGVLHHMPDTRQALHQLHFHLKPGGKLLLYLYYNLEGRGTFYKTLFRLSSALRKFVATRNPFWKKACADVLAFTVYVPLVLAARCCNLVAPSVAARLPLSYYMDKSLRIMRNDALDRFGTPLEKRFSRQEIAAMLEASGFADIIFSSKAPYWHCIATKK